MQNNLLKLLLHSQEQWEIVLRVLNSDLDLPRGSHLIILSPGSLISKTVTIIQMLQDYC